MKKIINVKLLGFTYFAMIGACILLNSGKDMLNDVASIVINTIMFVIIGVIFAWAIWGSLQKINEITKDLNNAANKINAEYESEKKYLLEKYCKEDASVLFENEDLRKLYEHYIFENKRLSKINQSGYKCNIEDYINYDWIDYKAKKNLLNLVPGAMTGMGILGTFIGLSLGLENFNTGTSSEIEASIPPLMEGIKVAFHTSIFGMIFSLIFNMVYKSILENAYRSLDFFLETFDRCVCSDVANDTFSRLLDGQEKQYEILSNPVLTAVQSMSENISLMLELQKKQYEEVKQMPGIMEEKIGHKMELVITPQFDRMNDNLEHFVKTISEAQLSSVSKLVDQFVYQMNGALSESFANLKDIISDTCELQKMNSDYMQNILQKVGTMTSDIQEINELSAKTIKSLSEYVLRMEELQSVLNQNFDKAGVQMEKNLQMEELMQNYITMLVEYEKEITESVKLFSKEMGNQVELLGKVENDITNQSKDSIDILRKQTDEYNSMLIETTKQQLKNVLELAEDFKGKTAAQILQVMESVKNTNAHMTENTAAQIGALVDTAKKVQGQMVETSEEQMQKLSETTNKFSVSLENQVQRVTDVISKSEKDLLNLVQTTNNQVLDLTGEQMDNIVTLSTVFGDNIKKRTEIIEEEAAERSAKAVEFSKKQIVSMEQMSQEFTEKLNKQVDIVVDATVKSGEQLSEVTQEQMKKLVSVANDCKENICEQLKIINEETEKRNKQMQENSQKNLEQMAAYVEKFNEKLTSQLNSVLEQFKIDNGNISNQSAEQIQKIINLSGAFQKDVMERLELIHSETERNIKSTTDMTRKYVEDLNKSIQSVELDMENAAKELGKASEGLNNQMERKVKDTFDIFDRGLSDIARCLSGTIGEVDSTTKRVPKVVAEAYDAMGKSFEEMQSEMQTMLHILAQVKESVPAVTTVKNEE